MLPFENVASILAVVFY